jgi:hypothetical protein
VTQKVRKVESKIPEKLYQKTLNFDQLECKQPKKSMVKNAVKQNQGSEKIKNSATQVTGLDQQTPSKRQSRRENRPTL